MDPVGIVFMAIFVVLLLAAVIIPQWQQRNQESE